MLTCFCQLLIGWVYIRRRGLNVGFNAICKLKEDNYRVQNKTKKKKSEQKFYTNSISSIHSWPLRKELPLVCDLQFCREVGPTSILLNIQPISQRQDDWQLSMGPLTGWKLPLIPFLLKSMGGVTRNSTESGSRLKFTGLNYRRGMAPGIISVLEFRDRIHVGPYGLLTMPRCLFLIKLSQPTSQRANPGCAIPPTPQELIGLNKTPAKLLDHIFNLHWRSVKWLRLRQIAGIYN